MAQMGFLDFSDRYASLDAKKDPLVDIDAIVPWEEVRAPLERVWRKRESERKSRAGRKPMDAVVMFKGSCHVNCMWLQRGPVCVGSGGEPGGFAPDAEGFEAVIADGLGGATVRGRDEAVSGRRVHRDEALQPTG